LANVVIKLTKNSRLSLRFDSLRFACKLLFPLLADDVPMFFGLREVLTFEELLEMLLADDFLGLLGVFFDLLIGFA
jgi:hypothetical protein